MLNLYTQYLQGKLSDDEWKAAAEQAKQMQKQLHKRCRDGGGNLGWLDYPVRINAEEIAAIEKAAEKIKNNSQVLLVVGVGGSYLGASAAVEFLHGSMYNHPSTADKQRPEIYFVGNNVSSAYLNDILKIVGERDFSVNIISKSGTTTEPAIAFRILRSIMEERYGKKGAAERIYCTTDANSGILREIAKKEGYATFAVPSDIGGRYSVLSPVGLLPIAVSGADIRSVITGAHDAYETYKNEDECNDCCFYAAARNIMYRKGRSVELLVTHEPSMTKFAEWFKQLFGESEGKEEKGLFPVSITYPTDLHSIGQYIQQGRKIAFETVLWVNRKKEDICIPHITDDNDDGLAYLAGESLNVISKKAMAGALAAHTMGDVPNVLIELDRQDEYDLGWMFYFFEKSCAISAYMLGVNPFDQPGVDAYKKNMFALLNKPGYEKDAEKVADFFKEFDEP